MNCPYEKSRLSVPFCVSPKKIENQLKILASNPGMGRKRNSLFPSLRSFPVGNYLIFYRSINQGIEVIRVLHGARDIQSLFEDPSEDE